MEGNTIKFNGRIFIYNHNASKYQTKIKRKIYFCQYHSHMINKLQKKNMPPFCKMKITFYPEQIEGLQFKITGEHSIECINKYNEVNPKKKKILYIYEDFEKKCFEEFNKQDNYKRSNFIEIAYKIINDNKIDLKINDNKIKNIISKWKNLTQRFTKYIFLNEPLTFDGKNLP